MNGQQEITERTTLLPPPPISADASPEAQLDNTQADETTQISASRLQISVAVAALGSLVLLQATNISLLSTTQTEIVKDLGAYDSTTWFTSSYLIALSSLGPLNGKLACWNSCVWAFGGFYSFIVGRVICGIGASGIFTVSIILVLELSTPKSRGLAIGILNTGYTIGVAGGAIVAGALLHLIGWRWLFLGQSPIAILAGIALFFSIPKDLATSKHSTKSLSWQLARLDYLGATALTASIVLILYALSSPTRIPIIPLVLSPVTLAVFVLIEIHWASDPVIPVTLLTSRGLLFSCLAQVGYMMARWSVLFYSPAYALALRSWSPAVAGTVLIPTNGGFALGGLLVGWLHIRGHQSFYLPTLTAFALFPLTLLGLSALTRHDSNIIWFMLDVLVCGLATGAALNYNLAHVLYMTPKSTHYISSSLLATFRGFSASFGSAVGGGLFTRTLYEALTDGFAKEGLQREELVHRLLGAPAVVQSLEGVEHKVAVAGYETAFRTLFLAGAGLAAIMVLIQAGTGWRAPSENKHAVEDDRQTRLSDGEV